MELYEPYEIAVVFVLVSVVRPLHNRDSGRSVFDRESQLEEFSERFVDLTHRLERLVDLLGLRLPLLMYRMQRGSRMPASRIVEVEHVGIG